MRPAGWLAAKDLALLRRSPLLVAILVIYPVALALMIGLALASPPGKPEVALYNGAAGVRGPASGVGAGLDVGAETRQLLTTVTLIPAASASAARADVRSGRAAAAIIVPADIVAQIESLVRTGVGQPSVQLVLNARSPLERQLVDAEIQTRVDELEAGISKALLGTALRDLHVVVAGGVLDFGGAHVSLLGLDNARRIVEAAGTALSRAGMSRALVPQLARVANFARMASDGLGFASPILGQVQAPLSVQRVELSGSATPTSTYAVAIAVTVSELFLALLLAAALLATERSEQVYARLVRGSLSRGGLLAEKTVLAATLAAGVGLVMSAVVSIFVGLSWGRVELWIVALVLAGLAFASLGVALGALAREVAAASLLAILVGLPVAFLALVPPTAVSAGLREVLDVISFVFPFKPGLEAISAALTRSSPAIGWPLVHLAGLAVAYAGLGRLALIRFD